ncbi:TIGR03089 family protein [Streptomyces durbertensis]|uniref:TIGR03089 family protein n=1 Tax=Streptomyces durbertensis TaxID=2448886 RepID=A0ABR6EGK6_9ACTN|nr:TIGR03089 family protein [Streptomyces durbertensis]MBB1243614.1 TIGR03089 family protein [Streptomyces durbertensis]
MQATDRTPADLLRSALESDSARPLVTFYDDATGERVELSVATFANWVAKTANLLQDELSAEPGDRLALLLPAHWQSAVWIIACSAAGVVVEPQGDPANADLVVSGPDQLEAARACSGERVALSLLPLGRRFGEPPAGFHDYAVEVPSQGDRFSPYAPVSPADPAMAIEGREVSGARVVEQARADAAALGLGPDSRVLSVRDYSDWTGVSRGLLAPLAAGGSVVLNRHADKLDPATLAARRESERITHTA